MAVRSTKNRTSGTASDAVRFTAALLLMPFLLGLARSLVWAERLHGRAETMGMSNGSALFIFGFLAFAVLYAAFRIPSFPYVVAHESTHVLFGLLAGAKISDWKVKPEKGSVRITRRGVLVLLAPYFVPLYLLILLAVFGALSALGPMVGTPLGGGFAALCGVAWGFHFCFTVNGFMQRQTDLEAYGFFFSFVIVLVLNLVVLGFVHVALTRIDLRDMIEVCRAMTADSYLWFWDWFWGWRGH